jgi:peptide chain release factor 1
MEKSVHDKLVTITEKYDRLTGEMATQEVASDPKRYAKVAKEQAGLTDVVRAFRRYVECETTMNEADEILQDEEDAEMRELAAEEKAGAEAELEPLEQQIKLLLVPKDPNDEKNTIVEIRAGTGGDEAALFAADLYRMYIRYAERKGWKVETMSANETGIGGIKEMSFKVVGDSVYSQLKFEGGVHRVQRVPATESQGRVHTSACSIAILPEAEEVELKIPESDLQFDVYRSSGPGGQSVNTTDSAVRVTHKPTGIIVTCQDEKSQHKNKAKALSVMRARLFAKKEAEENEVRAANRRLQVGTGDRSDKVRTYNFPQDRITDHRISRTQHGLTAYMDGDIQDMLDALGAADRADRMSEDIA